MTQSYDIAIVGSGPAGISAAARAAEVGMSHILFERSDHYADTIFKYQKGKYIMATPDILPLRSGLDFEAGIREDILGTWDSQLEAHKVNTRFGAEVTGIEGDKGNFTITINGSEKITAAHVVLCIGLQGNIRKMRIPGGDAPFVQYTVDDPEEYEDEDIVVVGAGDAAIENAVALAKQNRVVIVNRRGEFARAKTGNINLINKAIEDGVLECAFNANPARIEGNQMVLETADGEATYRVDRVVARLGAEAPRKFVEAMGVEFGSPDPGSYPTVSPQYESTKSGIYVIGALAGYPLIKHCMNQGYEVVEFIRGENIKPADEPLLEEKFGKIPGAPSVDDAILEVQGNIPLFSGLTTLQLREFLLDSEVHVKKPGENVFNLNDYGDSLFTILRGGVEIQIDADDPSKTVALGQGNFFGEIGLISGRRRSATINASADSVLIETPRRSAIKLINSVPSAQRVMDEVVIVRQLQTYLSPDLTREELAPVVESAELVSIPAGKTLIREGEKDDDVFIIRSGSVTVSRNIGGREIVLSYVPAGHYVGEMALLREAPRSATVKAAIKTEAIKLNGASFRGLLETQPALRAKLEGTLQNRVLQNVSAEADTSHGSVVEFLVGQGLGEATDVLLIDESLCVRCDNCEKACAETHGGISRLDREAGPTYAMVHVPTSCRHCEHPHCMADCPPDAIHRAPNGEVYIDDSCIGCGNCERNCPYGVIHMAKEPPKKPGLLSWLLFGAGPGPGEDKDWNKKHGKSQDAQKKAVKCDMCKGIEGGPACVRACPTGAAIRVSPEEFFAFTRENA